MQLFFVIAQVWDPVSLQLLSCTQAQSPGQPPPPLLKRCAAVLDPLTKSVTGLLEGLYLMAKVKYLSGVYKGSIAGVHRLLRYFCERISSTYGGIL